MKELIIPITGVLFFVFVIFHSTASVDIGVLKQHGFCTKKATVVYWLTSVGATLTALIFIVTLFY